MAKNLKLLLSFLIILLLVSCNKNTSTSTNIPTLRITEETSTFAVPTATPIPRPTLTPTPAVSEADYIRTTILIEPQAKAVRWSKDPYILRVRAENAGPDRLTATVTATCSWDFRFFLLAQEPNQQLKDSALSVIQENVILEPKINEQASYKEIFFGFTQAETVTVGTHIFSIQVNVPGEDPVRASIIFEVMGTYLTPSPSDTLPIKTIPPVP